jgi:hypothetical protein
MKKVDISQLSTNECAGIQIAGHSHCNAIDCKFQGLSACTGQQILKTGRNNKGYLIGSKGLVKSSNDHTSKPKL